MDAASRCHGRPAKVPGREQVQAETQGLAIAQEQYLYLTTRGRKTGLPREIEIWFTQREGIFYVIAEYDSSHWVQNLRANPEVKVRVAEKTFDARARVLTPETDTRVLAEIREFSSRKYGWGEGTVVELRPESDSEASLHANGSSRPSM